MHEGVQYEAVDIKPIMSPIAAGEDRNCFEDTHLSRDRCQNRGDGILDYLLDDISHRCIWDASMAFLTAAYSPLYKFIGRSILAKNSKKLSC